jgi:hypothetical protein
MIYTSFRPTSRPASWPTSRPDGLDRLVVTTRRSVELRRKLRRVEDLLAEIRTLRLQIAHDIEVIEAEAGLNLSPLRLLDDD